jgi:chromosome segregation ATPase
LNDADRLREALHEVTREKNELSLQLESIKDSNSQSDKESMPTDLSTDMVDYQLERKAYEDEINELGITVTSLKEELNAKDDKFIGIQSSLQATIDNLME